MNKRVKLSKFLGYLIGTVTLSLVLATSSFAAPAWYKVKVTQIVPRSASGDVFVQFNPGASETRFTQTARGVLLGGDTGTNKVMAVLLTAITLNAEITMLLDNVPSFANIQVIQSTGLVAP